MAPVNKSGSRESDDRRLLGYAARDLAAQGSLFTSREIIQQPEAWRQAQMMIEARREEIWSFLEPLLARPRSRVYFCGAGTSEFIGETLATWLRSRPDLCRAADFESVGTTDFVADPRPYAATDRPTVMISFARSGDSPESLAAVKLADQLLRGCHHLVITCNPNGQLAKFARSAPNALCVMMPSQTNDRGFAMTSSYSSMLVSCVLLFSDEKEKLEQTARAAEAIINQAAPGITDLVEISFDRLVVLGSGLLKGTAREAGLKCTELAAGQLMSVCDTPLGFRHGPKIVISPSTVVLSLLSTNPYTRMYDEDLVNELRSDGLAARVIELSPEQLHPDVDPALDDIWASLLYIVWSQIFAFANGYKLGVQVDSPCPSGEVNRVVQGVTIHPYSR